MCVRKVNNGRAGRGRGATGACRTRAGATGRRRDETARRGAARARGGSHNRQETKMRHPRRFRSEDAAPQASSKRRCGSKAPTTSEDGPAEPPQWPRMGPRRPVTGGPPEGRSGRKASPARRGERGRGRRATVVAADPGAQPGRSSGSVWEVQLGEQRATGGPGGIPRKSTAGHSEADRKVGEYRATPGGYGGKPPGVAFIGVPTGARDAGRCSDGGPEHR